MRYHIDTIPVWDAYRQRGECPLCDLSKDCEQSYLESFLGASVMEPAVRIEVNQKGFCAPHLAQMIQKKNKLGLALMMHTHLKERMQTVEVPPARGSGLFRKKTAPAAIPEETCILCDRLASTMDRYVYTVLHLWKTDQEFASELERSKGHCMPHHQKLLAMAAREFGADMGDAFAKMLIQLQKENMDRIEKELEWFTLKFDYRNTDKPWGESKDAVERAINKLRGKCV